MLFINDIQEVLDSEDGLSLAGDEIFSFRTTQFTFVEIDLSGNFLTSFEGSFPFLKYLYLSNNRLTIFEGSFPLIEYLDLSNNSLGEFSLTSKMPCLKRLYLNRNLLEVLPPSEVFPNLKLLYIQDNRLTEINGRYPKLIHMYAANNFILKTVFDAPFIETLNLNQNRISSFDGCFPLLKTLILSKNDLVYFDPECPLLETLSISYNPRLCSLPKHYPNVFLLHFKGTKIHFLRKEYLNQGLYSDLDRTIAEHERGITELINEFLPYPIAEEIIPHIHNF